MALFTSVDLCSVLQHLDVAVIADTALDNIIPIFRFLSEVALFWMTLRHPFQTH